jgi:2-oxoglutarate/2-oxoacid ferredoxin oxidoreductase subunit alpha
MCGAAAIFAGCTFFGGYPITPSTEIMQYLGRELWKYGGVVLQAEDEIAGIGAVVGASFAGKKAMTATSGPGHVAQDRDARAGHDRRAAARLRQRAARRALDRHPDQERAVGPAPGGLLLARRRGAAGAGADDGGGHLRHDGRGVQHRRGIPDAGHPADRGELGQRKEIVAPIDTSKYRLVERAGPTEASSRTTSGSRTESGISPISEPGMPGGNYLASGIEHNEAGAPTANGAIHARMNEKRIRKLNPAEGGATCSTSTAIGMPISGS